MFKRSKDGIIKSAFTLGIGIVVSKLLGALYRIPLTNLIGGAGLGLYQMVFPVYALLLDFSGAGAPGALSKLISSEKQDKERNAFNYLSTACILLTVLGLFFTILLLSFAKPLSIFQGNGKAFSGYLCLAPAVSIVCLISCFRGYFQGLMDMTPVSISQVVEQVIKLILGLLFAKLFMPNVALAVAGATLAITLSELIALLQLFIAFKRRKNKLSLKFAFEKKGFVYRSKKIVKYAFPIIVVGLMIPLSHVIDSFIILKILGSYRNDATTLYGILSGAVHTVINLPVSVCYAVATVAIPSVSSVLDRQAQESRIQKLIVLTLALSIPCAIACYIFAPTVIGILFRSFSPTEKAISVGLLRTCSPIVVLLSVLQTQNAILIAKNKLYLPSLSLLLGLLLKTVVSIILLKNPEFNIYGGAIGSIACYFLSCLVNLFMIFTVKVKNDYQTFASRQRSTQ
ncbi:MAG: polysaccharide biosynthesis protein [Clostridia bacterium]|nr:polysaccharide biosynthesis protein [Clostridia bacterium]